MQHWKEIVKTPWLLALVLVPVLVPLWGTAARAAQAETAEEEQLRYVPLQPSFVTNFGDGADGRLQYVKADVSLRVSSAAAASAVRYHLPALRNAVVLLLSRQDASSVSTGSGREAIRAEALAELRAILEAEEGEPYIEDVLFTNFLVQR